MKKRIVTALVLTFTFGVGACSDDGKIHQGYSETIEQYEVDGNIVSNVDTSAFLWNPRNKSEEQIAERAQFLTDAADTRIPAQIQTDKAYMERYKDAIVINSLMPTSVGIIGNTVESFTAGVERNRKAGVTHVSSSVGAFHTKDVMYGFIRDTDPVIENLGLTKAKTTAEHVDHIAMLIGKEGTCYGSDYTHNLYDAMMIQVPMVEKYPPEKGFASPSQMAGIEDIWAIVAARYGRPVASHTRLHGSPKPPTESQMGFNELFTNASLLDAPLLICHNNDYGWWEIEEKLKMARGKGMNMWSEYYPYKAASTAIGASALRPESIEGLLGLKYSEVLYDPSQDKYLSKEEYLQVAKEDPSRTVVVFNPAREKWLPMWLRVAHMTVGSDGMWQTEGLVWDDDPAKFKGHPRTSGTHAKVLRLGREHDVPLMLTLAQLSYWSAYHLGKIGLKMMDERGRLQTGMAADIVIFDPKTVKEGSDYRAGTNGLPSLGMPHVLVNGQLVKKDNKATDVMAGLPVRFPVEDKGRHIDAKQEQWKDEMLLDDGALHATDME